MKPAYAHWSLKQWLQWQESLHPKTIELGLARVREVALRMQLPDTRMRTLTVAGTNGKGSSAALAALIYREAGYRVGLYTSPHLLRYNERIAINGELASDADLCRAFMAVEQARMATPLTYFEFGTLAALWLFREAAVDVQVLEVGLGGRLDAVNLVDADCALITNIGLDHTDWLGADRESIAREKAGVMRAEKPVVCVDLDAPAAIAETAQNVGAGLIQLGNDYYFTADADTWHWCAGERAFADLPSPGLRGIMQCRNAAGVIAAIMALQPLLPVTEMAIRAALPKLRLSGRFQKVGQVILDVAHNAEAAQVLADNLRAEKFRRLWLVLGMFADKPVESVCAALAPLVERAFLGGLPGPRGLSGEDLGQRARSSGLNFEIHPDIAAAFAQAKKRAEADDCIVVTGSFLTVAAVAEILLIRP